MRDVFNRRHPIDTAYNSTSFISGQDRCCLATVFLHARAYGLFIVVRTTLEFRGATFVTNTFLRGKMEDVVIASAAIGTGVTPGDPLHESVFIDLQLDHMIELAIMLRENVIQLLGLRCRARDP